MAIFTEEKYREILIVRERLRQYRDKIQPYPLLPKYVPPSSAYRPPESEMPKEQVVVHRHSNMGAEERDMLQQTSLKADYLEKRLNEHTERSKSKSKYKLEG